MSWRGIAGVTLLAMLSWLSAQDVGRSHLDGIECSRCHLAGATVSPVQARRLIASQEVLCGTCHGESQRMSHPSGVVPGAAMPADYPVDWKRELTCSSCHTVHGGGAGLLRGDRRGRDFCLACHPVGFFDAMADAGVSIQRSAHLGLPRQPGDDLEIDRFSLTCIGCHEDRVGAVGPVRIGTTGVVRHPVGGVNHPIGRIYPTSAAEAALQELRPIPELPREIWLPQGRVGCVSCHEGYRRRHGELVVSREGSELCVVCHRL